MNLRLDFLASYVPPKRVAINEIVDDARVAASFVADGFANVAISDIDIVAMAEVAVERICGTPGFLNDVDGIIISTDSYDSHSFGNSKSEYSSVRSEFKRMFSRYFGEDTTLYSVGMNGCLNFAQSLSVATGLVASGAHEKVLVVLCDRATWHRSRILDNGAAVLGDAAGCFTVSGEGRWMVELIATQAIPSTSLSHGFSVLKAAQKLRRVAECRLGRPLDTVMEFFGDNLHFSTYQIVAEGLGISLSKVSLPNKHVTGHAFACDCLLALQQRSAETGKVGNSIGAINISGSRLGLLILRD
ncbi:hypothetical protein LAV84_30240 [Rhizobium sp. VS19-DR104.2]|uniref:hypothetical protein n=1 Tax=unclassified Rhizobium TaxID=2613769 RepID=UPI001CC82A88|nr:MULTISPECIES: hypothetical protein [unclassified Rhizobium]MBZ5763726.1 hypothetical protein [Rhizobium sp. VS19-DR96]MBZ5769660.1 hypothetical protein [Rhizobium sp. VS19-DR129.2]MBZ5777197.1 hypothetical protein [Rhizobium sp. VS19-DRK62.2]MBZ5788340.1 hypothetical protein [Rhizobium sp. VS19-DR121]MBZ5805751.1 hypothetical protein [Rhizobium sp. VS19-DR181]